MRRLRLSDNGYGWFIQGFSIYGGTAGLAQLLMMVQTILIIRALAPQDFGTFSGSYALTGLTVFMVSWGMDTWLLKEAAGKYDPLVASGFVLKVKAAIGLIWGFLLVLLAPVLRPDVFTPGLMLVCVLDVWFDSCFNTQMAALNVQKRLAEVSKFMFISRGGRLACVIIVLLIHRTTPLNFALARGTATLLSLILVTGSLRPVLRQKMLFRLTEIVRHTASYGLSEFLALVYAQADITLLTLMSGKTATGIYSPASGLVNALFVVPNAGFLMAIPPLSRLASTEHTRLRSLVLPLHLGFFVLGLALTGGVILVGKSIVEILLGDNYHSTGILLVILSPILLFKSIEYASAALIVAVGWQRDRLVPQAISALANILINIAIIPVYGALGVAVVYVLSEIILTFGYVGLVIKWLRKPLPG